MPDMSLLLGEPFAVPHNVRCSRKAFVLLSLLGGLGLAAVFSVSNGRNHSASYPWPSVLTPEPALAMASQVMRPTMRMRQPTSGVAMPVAAMQAITSSPLAKLAVTSIEAVNQGKPFHRDISVMASMSNKDKVTMRAANAAVAAKAKEMAGVTAPMGFFDPVGFSSDCSEGKLLFYREVELKHGRVGMLASLGFLVGEQWHPLFGGNIDVPSYVAFQQTPLETFWGAVVVAIAIPEAYSVFQFAPPDDGGKGFEWWTMKPDRVPGDFGFDPLGLKPDDPAEFKALQTKELNNGRLAMLAAAGMIAQELATGKKLF